MTSPTLQKDYLWLANLRWTSWRFYSMPRYCL